MYAKCLTCGKAFYITKVLGCPFKLFPGGGADRLNDFLDEHHWSCGNKCLGGGSVQLFYEHGPAAGNEEDFKEIEY